MNWGPRFEVMCSGVPCSRTTCFRNSFVVSSPIMVLEHGTKWAIFENRSTITITASCPQTGGRSMMKSIEMEVQGLLGTGSGWRSPYGRWRAALTRAHMSLVSTNPSQISTVEASRSSGIPTPTSLRSQNDQEEDRHDIPVGPSADMLLMGRREGYPGKEAHPEWELSDVGSLLLLRWLVDACYYLVRKCIYGHFLCYLTKKWIIQQHASCEHL